MYWSLACYAQAEHLLQTRMLLALWLPMLPRSALLWAGAGAAPEPPMTEWEGAKVLEKGVQIGTVLQCSISISSLYGMLNVPAIREARSMGHQLLDGHRNVGSYQLSVDQQRHAL